MCFARTVRDTIGMILDVRDRGFCLLSARHRPQYLWALTKTTARPATFPSSPSKRGMYEILENNAVAHKRIAVFGCLSTLYKE